MCYNMTAISRTIIFLFSFFALLKIFIFYVFIFWGEIRFLNDFLIFCRRYGWILSVHGLYNLCEHFAKKVSKVTRKLKNGSNGLTCSEETLCAYCTEGCISCAKICIHIMDLYLAKSVKKITRIYYWK